MNDQDYQLVIKTLEQYTRVVSDQDIKDIVCIISFITDNNKIQWEDIPTVRTILSAVKFIYTEWIEKTNAHDYPDREMFQNFYREKINDIEIVLQKL